MLFVLSGNVFQKKEPPKEQKEYEPEKPKKVI
jgi:hypothetical protein